MSELLHTYLSTFKTKMLYYIMLCCSTSVLQTSQPATNQTYRSLHCCWRIYVMTPCIQWKDFLPRLLLVSVSGDGLCTAQRDRSKYFFYKILWKPVWVLEGQNRLGFSWTQMMLSVIWGPFFIFWPKMKMFSYRYIFVFPFFSEISQKMKM